MNTIFVSAVSMTGARIIINNQKNELGARRVLKPIPPSHLLYCLGHSSPVPVTPGSDTDDQNQPLHPQPAAITQTSQSYASCLCLTWSSLWKPQRRLLPRLSPFL